MKTNRPMPLVGGARLPLAFIAFGLTTLVVACAWLAAEPALARQPHLHPHVVALGHLWLPGFLLSVCFGATYQLTPVVLGAPLSWEKGTWVHLALHVAGLPLLAGGFVTAHSELVAAGGGLIAGGVLLFAANVFVTFARAERRDAIGWSLPLASGWLVLTVLGGLLLAATKLGLRPPVSPLGLLRAHAHAGLAGFFLTLIQGVAFQLVPMFTLGDLRQPWRVAAGLAGTQGGLMALTLGLAFGREFAIWAGVAGLLAGVAFSGVELVVTLRVRRKRVLEPGLKAFAIGAVLIACAGASGVGLLLTKPGIGALRGAFAYGVIVIAGALAFMVLGMLCKIIPFLVWMRAYGPRVGRQVVPAAHTLGNSAWEKIWIGLHAAGIAALAGGMALDAEISTRVGAWMLAAGVGSFVVNVLKIAAHLRVQPMTEAPRVEIFESMPRTGGTT